MLISCRFFFPTPFFRYFTMMPDMPPRRCCRCLIAFLIAACSAVCAMSPMSSVFDMPTLISTSSLFFFSLRHISPAHAYATNIVTVYRLRHIHDDFRMPLFFAFFDAAAAHRCHVSMKSSLTCHFAIIIYADALSFRYMPERSIAVTPPLIRSFVVILMRSAADFIDAHFISIIFSDVFTAIFAIVTFFFPPISAITFCLPLRHFDIDFLH